MAADFWFLIAAFSFLAGRDLYRAIHAFDTGPRFRGLSRSHPNLQLIIVVENPQIKT